MMKTLSTDDLYSFGMQKKARQISSWISLEKGHENPTAFKQVHQPGPVRTSFQVLEFSSYTHLFSSQALRLLKFVGCKRGKECFSGPAVRMILFEEGKGGGGRGKKTSFVGNPAKSVHVFSHFLPLACNLLALLHPCC